jgi:predicted RNA-binding protein with TRAM domain
MEDEYMYGDRGYGGDRGGFRGSYGGGGGGFRDNNRFAPVKEGDELDVKIEAVGEKGDGIAKKQGFVLFVPKTKAGDEVRIRVTKVLKNAGFAEVLGQAQASPASEQKPAKRQDEEFNPSTEDDSESFGDEAEAEEVAESSDDELDENSEKVQED